MRMIVLAFIATAMTVSNAVAQTSSAKNSWATVEECLSPDADSAPYYIPEIRQTRRFNPKTEIRLGLPQESCVELDLPDRIANADGFAWIKARSGEPHIYQRLPGNLSGKLLRRDDCENEARRVVPRQARVAEATPIQGPQGLQGPEGPQGPPGIQGPQGPQGNSYSPPAESQKWYSRLVPKSKKGKIISAVVGTAIAVGGYYVVREQDEDVNINRNFITINF